MTKGMAVPGGLLLPLLLVLVACGDDVQRPTPTTPTPAAALPSPTPVPSPTPTPALMASGQPKVIFVRHLSSPFTIEGALWMGNPDGSEETQLTPDDVMATFVGFSGSKSGNAIFYYLTHDDERAYTLWRLDLATGERSSIISFESSPYRPGEASLSPDGRAVAFSHIGGIDSLDLTTGEKRALLVNGPPQACETGPLRDCFVYSFPQWSPDSILLLVQKGFYEGGHSLVFDASQSPAAQLTQGRITGDGPFNASWSPTGSAVCAHGKYAAPSGLYMATIPDWYPRNLLPDYEEPPTGFPLTERWVTSCDWLDDSRIVFATEVNEYAADQPSPQRYIEVSVYDLAVGQVLGLATFSPGHFSSPYVLAVPGDRYAVTQYYLDPSGGHGDYEPARPELLDLTTGVRQPILREGDWVVAVVQP